MPTQSKLYRLDGIVLSRRDHSEADRVIIVLTPEGRVDLLAKGVRKPRSRKSGHLELFNRVTMLVSRVKDSWDIVSQAEATVVHPRFQDDFELATYARYVAELVLQFFETETDEHLFALVEATLTHLECYDRPELLIRWFEQQLLELAGFKPVWDMCVGEREGALCQVELHPRPEDKHLYGVDPERGGALCADCATVWSGSGPVRSLTPSALSWLQALQKRSFDDLASFKLPNRTAHELGLVMSHYIAYHLDRRPGVLRLLE